MAITARLYPNAIKNAWLARINWDTDTIKDALIANTYTPSDSHEFFSTSVSAHQVTGTGYTAGGDALVTTAPFVVGADSATARANSTVYQVGDVVRPSTPNGHFYIAIVAGTSGGSAPTWPTASRATVTDGSVTWAEGGVAYVSLDSDNPSWPTSTITARYKVTYVAGGTPGTNDYLIGWMDFGQNESSNGDLFEVQYDPLGAYIFTTDF